MFEISGTDITTLRDDELRSLVAQLAKAELRKKGYPLSSVTAGGNQDASDGGLDVRVECPSGISNPDFVPRRLTGFQVKKPDMPASAIQKEMRPQGVLRDVIHELAKASGSYIIVSAQGSVSDTALADRQKAMRGALKDLRGAARLHTDFYDRDRIANWVNEYPGIAAWVRRSTGRPLSGWSGIHDWGGTGDALEPFLSDQQACLIEAQSQDHKAFTIKDGIVRLRSKLRTPRSCIRLVGLSGLGKTRLVQALFEEGVGDDPLNPGTAIYTDYSEETVPTARDMARMLIALGQHAILIVDNCNPAAHSELASLCSGSGSQVSLITVEYDVREDEPEQTEVFRMESASADLLTEWIKQTFPYISQVDRGQIAEFSDGNFRVARALAETLNRGESLGRIKSTELFERIFQQRNSPNHELLSAAEDLSLLFSIDGEDVSAGSELFRVGMIRQVSAQELYEWLAEMRRRGVVQTRGRFRAILPQAISNRLAARALERIPPSIFDEFCADLPPRMIKSVSRRLGYLHDSTFAQSTVARWLRSDGPLGDLLAMGEEGLQILTNIAPIAPHDVLAKLAREFDGTQGPLSGPQKCSWIRLIKVLGYEPALFDTAVMLLARLLVAEPPGDSQAKDAFREYFQLLLSGTHASPEQRRAAIRLLARSNDPGLRNCAIVALSALLKSNHFSSSGNYEFGARSRDWGWRPKTNQETWDWFVKAIQLTMELASETDARLLLAENARGLWGFPSCPDALEHAASIFSRTQPWIEGWAAFRAALHYDGNKMPQDVQERLQRLIVQLKPSDLFNRARAIVLNRLPAGVDFTSDEESDAKKPWQEADQKAYMVGRELASHRKVRADFLVELFAAQHAIRPFDCGRGLAEGTDDLSSMWIELITAYKATALNSGDIRALGGFVARANELDRSFTSGALDSAIEDPSLCHLLPYLQARADIDQEGIARFSRAIRKKVVTAADFLCIANGSVSKLPPESLAVLLDDLTKLTNGEEIALDLLHAYLHREAPLDPNSAIVLVGRDLLTRTIFRNNSNLGDYEGATVIRVCLVGEEGRSAAALVCSNIRSSTDSSQVYLFNLPFTLEALFEIQPIVALDEFLLPTAEGSKFALGFRMVNPIENVDPEVLITWAKKDPETRFPLLGEHLRLFETDKNEEGSGLSRHFLLILDASPDKRRFLGDLSGRIYPGSWSGSEAGILISRKSHLLEFAQQTDELVRAAIYETIPTIDRSIEHAQKRDRESEESFE